jgi:hypothetical protein
MVMFPSIVCVYALRGLLAFDSAISAVYMVFFGSLVGMVTGSTGTHPIWTYFMRTCIMGL